MRRKGIAARSPWTQFNHDEDDDEDAKGNEGSDDAAVGPWLGHAAPLESEEVANDGADEDGNAGQIKLEDLFFPGCFDWLRSFRWLEREYDNGSGNGTNGKIDVEAPAPGDGSR